MTLNIKLIIKTFCYRKIKKYSNFFTIFLSLSFNFIILNSSALAQNYFYYEYEEHSIPLCASRANISSSGNMRMHVRTFVTINNNLRLVCGANVFTISEGNIVKPLEYVLEYIKKEYLIVDYFFKNNVLFIESTNNGKKYYHGVIVVDSIHIIQFLTSAEFDSVARNALIYMMKNFR